jgi:hypothetical protein
VSGHRAARWAANALIVAASCLVALAAFELGVRLLRPQPMASVARSPRLGWMHKPNTEMVYERREFRVPVRFSSFGLRDREYPLQKPPGTLRIAWLGDSFVEALQVPLDSCATERLEARLAATAGRRSEVLNFGVSGYGTCQQLLLLEEMALRFEPDLVLAQYYFNDLDDDRKLGMCGLDAEGALVVTPAAQLTLVTRLTSATKSFLYRHSHLWMFVSTRQRRTVRPGGRAETAADAAMPAVPLYDEAGGVPVPSCPGRHKSFEWFLTLHDLPAETQRALDQHAAIWERMAARCRARGARFVGIIGVSRTQIEPEVYAKTLRDTGCRAAAHDWDLAPARLKAAAAARGVEVIDLLPAFRAATAAGETLHFRIDGHWNAAGNRVAAAAVCDTLRQRGILEPVQP